MIRNAQTADLHAAVDHAGLGIAGELELEAEVEILERAGRREEGIFWDLFGRGAASDGAILHAPPFEVALPTGEGAAIEERGSGSGVERRDGKQGKNKNTE